jgi:hypothetical protein
MSSIDCAVRLAAYQRAVEVTAQREAPWSAAACRRFSRVLGETAQKAAASCRTPRRGCAALNQIAIVGITYATEVPA